MPTIDTTQKALEINLTEQVYGTFAEIGAGQEVVRHFFRAGGAAGTVAKSMSAYDMVISDEIYGACDRYVSEARLTRMLDYEYDLLVKRLEGKRPNPTAYFVFADTVATRGFRKLSECHGWLGVRFQTAPGAQPSQVSIHVRMLDKQNAAQQRALGILGVNLIYGCVKYWMDTGQLIQSMMDSLSSQQIEIDTVHFAGPAFAGADNRQVNLSLVFRGLCPAILFSADGGVIPPGEFLHKRPILSVRGAFRPVTRLHTDMFAAGLAHFGKDMGLSYEEAKSSNILQIPEITINNVFDESDATPPSGGETEQDYLERVDLLNTQGYNVLVTNFQEYFRLVQFYSRYTNQMIGIVLGVQNLIDIFQEKYYRSLPGGILESFGILFNWRVKLFVYPWKAPDGKIVTSDNVAIGPKVEYLYKHLQSNGYFETIQIFDETIPQAYSRDVIRMLQNNDPGWKKLVTPEVASRMEKCGLFRG